MGKQIILVAAFMLLWLSGEAQIVEKQNRTNKDTITQTGVHNIGWLRSHHFDNWYITPKAGTNIYMGFEDGKGSLLDRFGDNFEINIGHWIFPVVGIQMGAGYGHCHGFVSSNSYLQYREYLTRDYGHCEGRSTTTSNVGGTTVTGALGGYYWTVEDNPNILRQDWRYVFVGGDFIINFSYLKPYMRVNSDKKWNHVGYAGFDVRIGVSENNDEKFSNAIGYSSSYGEFKNTNFSPEGHLGYACIFRPNEHIGFYGEVKLAVMEGDFDRERIENVELMAPDINLNISFGVTYDFNMRSDFKRKQDMANHNIMPYSGDKLPRFINYVQEEKREVFVLVDTILVIERDVREDTIDTVIINSLIAQLNKTIEIIDTIPDTIPLEELFNRQIVPFEMVFFELDKWDILPSEEMKITKMAQLMKLLPNRKFTLIGSADSKTGTIQRNQLLGINRATVVYNKLVSEYGIPKEQLQIINRGGILDYDPYILNRTTAIIMDHPAIQKAFNEQKSQRKAGGGIGIIDKDDDKKSEK